MSNVLIGIIGVILFIGLALAGALILGDDFKTSTASSKASEYVSELNQIGQAANMYELKTGKKIPFNSGTPFLKPRFLASSFDSTKPYNLGRRDATTAYVYRSIPSSEKDVCLAIQELNGTANDDGTLNLSIPWSVDAPNQEQIGCLRQGDSFMIFKSI